MEDRGQVCFTDADAKSDLIIFKKGDVFYCFTPEEIASLVDEKGQIRIAENVLIPAKDYNNDYFMYILEPRPGLYGNKYDAVPIFRDLFFKDPFGADDMIMYKHAVKYLANYNLLSKPAKYIYDFLGDNPNPMIRMIVSREISRRTLEDEAEIEEEHVRDRERRVQRAQRRRAQQERRIEEREEMDRRIEEHEEMERRVVEKERKYRRGLGA
jgi:hypothetical protein